MDFRFHENDINGVMSCYRSYFNLSLNHCVRRVLGPTAKIIPTPISSITTMMMVSSTVLLTLIRYRSDGVEIAIDGRQLHMPELPDQRVSRPCF